MKAFTIAFTLQLVYLYCFPQFVADSLWQVSTVHDEYPCYSPDGNKIAFMSNRFDDNFEICVMDSDGKNIRRLTHHPGLDETPVWSPDGSTIAFASNREGNLDLYLIDADGNNLRQLTTSAGNDDHPKFSSDGMQIIFNSDRDQPHSPTDYEIYEINLETGQEIRRTQHPKWDSYPSYSTDHSKILWRRVLEDAAGNRNSEIFVMNTDGSQVTNLTDHPAFDGYPEWSPDGEHIAFVSNRNGSERLYMMRADGSELVALTDNSEGIEDVRPSFHPNGDQLIFNRVTKRGTFILSMDLNEIKDPIFFTETTKEMHLEQLGASRGAAWGDYDQDGFPDLLVTNSMNQTEMLYQNHQGAFLRISEGPVAEAGGWSEGAQWIDYDNDHDLDLFIATQHQTPNQLFENIGEGQFAVASAGDLTNQNTSSTGSCWCDYDGDGDLDVYVMERDGAQDALYNNQAGTFEKVSDFPYSGGDGRACIWGDTNSDGHMDLLVANYRDILKSETSAHRNFYYLNQGQGQFKEVGEGTLVTEVTPSYGLSLVDYDNDGDQDLFITNVARTNPNRLYQNNGQGVFSPVDSLAMIEAGGPSKGQTWGDFDNDGDQDLYVANGTQHTDPKNLRNYLYLNSGNGNFHKVNHGVLVTEEEISAGTSWADYDRDGDLDLFVSNWGDNQQHNSFYTNQTKGHHWIALKLKGTRSNTMGIGARVRVKATINGQPKWQTRWMINNSGYGSQNEPLIHFGLGNANLVEELEIRWPSGQVDRYRQIAPDQYLEAEEDLALNPAEFAVADAP